MRNLILLLGAAGLAACGSSDQQAKDAAAKAAAAPKPEKPPHCFFKDADTKGWKASVDKDGNVVVTGKAYRSDSRYQAVIGKTVIAANGATVWPTITINTTGYGAPDNWWDIKATLPGSAAVDHVTVKCGAKSVAELAIKRKP